MLTDFDFNFLIECQQYGEIGVNEFLYLLCEYSDFGAGFLKRFFDDVGYLNGLDKFSEQTRSVNIGKDSEISIADDLKKFASFFPLSIDSPYSSASLLYFLMTSNSNHIRNQFIFAFQKFFDKQEKLKPADKQRKAGDIYAMLKARIEDETALGHLVKQAKEHTRSQNRDQNIAFALSQKSKENNEAALVNDEQNQFLAQLKNARKNLMSAKEIAELLKLKVIGQDAVCDKMGEILFPVVNNFSLLEDRKTPIARMLFCGPSGSGKTLLSETIAKNFFDTDTLLIPCSQYRDSISANRLFGSTPGYVGYDDDTPLQTYLRSIRKSGKKGVIIFDELEKMHPAVLNSLLTAFDGNSFTMHAKGVGNETFNLTNCLIIGTSNLASDELAKGISRLGFTPPQQNPLDDRTDKDKFELIKNAAKNDGISTEFFNRFEHVFSFKKLTEEDYKKIAKEHCEATLAKIKAKLPSLKVKIDDTAINLISKLAKERGENTRIVENMSTTSLADTITKYLLDNEGSENSSIVITADGNNLNALSEESSTSGTNKFNVATGRR